MEIFKDSLKDANALRGTTERMSVHYLVEAKVKIKLDIKEEGGRGRRREEKGKR